jgi:hypothetical protein
MAAFDSPGGPASEEQFLQQEEELDALSNDQLVEAMLQAKNDRRRAESDVQLLANRLAHLRAEEEKARRKISETKRRAEEVATMKKRNALLQKKKAEEKQMRNQVIQREQQRVAMRRAAQRAKRSGANNKLNEDKLRYVREQREQAKMHREQVLEGKLREEQRAKKLKDKIRQREIRLKMKREEEEKQRRSAQAKAYRKRLQEERVKQDIADSQISAMEEEEMRLIERLRKTQDMQRKAYASLETALSEPVKVEE